MRVDLYSACWNNADLLGYFFRHYDAVVNNYFIYYDNSDDRSLEILKSHPRVEVRDFQAALDGAGRIAGSMELAETCWRDSSADADWVVIAETDEHLYHSDLTGYLARCRQAGVTAIPALGYQMVSPSFPAEDRRLCETIVRGAPWTNMSKLSAFAPSAIERLNFSAGRHRAEPAGDIVIPAREELLLLHYKYLDFERVYQRHLRAQAQITRRERDNHWGHKYFWSRDQLLADWRTFEEHAVDVTRPDLEPWRTHPEPRWWTELARAQVAPALFDDGEPKARRHG